MGYIMHLVDLTCTKCGAILQVNSELTEATCNYCGNRMLISRPEHKEHIISYKNAYQDSYDIEKGKLQAQLDIQEDIRLREEEKLREYEEQQKELENTRRTGKVATIVFLVIVAIAGSVCIVKGNIIAGLCSVLVIYLVVNRWRRNQ